jgi:UDP-glucuronate 4-epimerase
VEPPGRLGTYTGSLFVMESALVTGAAGFIGSHLCARLRGDGVHVRGVDSMSSHYARALKEINLAPLAEDRGFTFDELDLVQADAASLVDRVGAVFHLAARPGVRDSWSDFDDYVANNVQATKVLLDACVGSDTPFVYASSSSVYGDASELPVSEETSRVPISPYGATKVMTEVMAGAYAAAHGLKTIGLRYFTVYGPRQRPDMGISKFIEAAVAGRPITVYGDGRQLRDFTYVDDVVEATVLAARHGHAGSVYNVASSNPQPLLTVLDHLGEVLGSELDLLHEESKLGDVRDTWADVTRAAEELGYAPTTSLRDGLAAQVAEAERRRSLLAAR